MKKRHSAELSMQDRCSIDSALPRDCRRFIKAIHGALSLDLLSRDYAKLVSPYDHPTTGHCYIATEALYYLWGKHAGFRPQTFRHPGGGTHWWLLDVDSGQIADPTAPQMPGSFKYSKGRNKGFENPSPSRRTLELIRRVKVALDRGG